jgi:hypothetical protein
MIYIDLRNEPKAKKYFGSCIISSSKVLLVERLLSVLKPKHVKRLMLQAKEGDP